MSQAQKTEEEERRVEEKDTKENKVWTILTST
jgi:hypothetical protein